MPIKKMRNNNTVLNKGIQSTCEMIYDIEDLLVRGPKQLESYSSLYHVLKDMKRGQSLRTAINKYAVQCCPPGTGPGEHCESLTCQSCWEERVRAFLDKIKEQK